MFVFSITNQCLKEPFTILTKTGIFKFNRVAKPSQVYFGGTVVGEQAMKYEDEVGSLIEYEFRVSCRSWSFHCNKIPEANIH